MLTTLLRVGDLSPCLHTFRTNLLRALLMCLAAITVMPQEMSHAMQGTTEPVVIMIRDCAGNPMPGIAMKILIDVAAEGVA